MVDSRGTSRKIIIAMNTIAIRTYELDMQFLLLLMIFILQKKKKSKRNLVDNALNSLNQLLQQIVAQNKKKK